MTDVIGALILAAFVVLIVARWSEIPGHTVESNNGQTEGTELQSNEVGDLETRPKGWEGSE